MSMKIGVTGGIGSGKSYVCSLLQKRYGAPVYDCDSRAKQLLIEDAALRHALIDAFGPDVYHSDNTLNRPFLAAQVFASAQHTARMNALVHPAVKRDFVQWVARHADAPFVVLESAILFESGFRDVVDAVLSVEAPEALRLQRACLRDSSTPEQIRARMARQLTDAERRLRADVVVCNDGQSPLAPLLDRSIQRLLSLPGSI